MPSLIVSDITVGEGDGHVDVVVRLSEASATAVTTRWEIVPWTANYGDYVEASGSLSFNPGETIKTVSVVLRYAEADGKEPDGLERFKFQLSSPTNATLADQGFGWVTVVDNDTLVNTPEIYVRDIVVDEAGGKADIVVTLGRVWGQSTTGTVTVAYQTMDGSAAAGTDYTSTSGILSFLPGQSAKVVSVPLTNDSVAELAETFSLRLSSPATGVIIRDTAVATIGANDAPPLPQPRISVADLTVGEGDRFADVVVSLNAPSASKVTVNYASSDWTANYGDFASFSGTLSFDPGETTQVVRVDLAYWDVENERDGLERFKFQLSSPTNATLADQGHGWVTIVDNDTAVDTPEVFVRDVIVDEGASKADFVVTLGRVWGQSTTGTVTVAYQTVDGSAAAGSDYTSTSGTLTFLPGESAKVVSVPLINDTAAEGPEAFALRLANAATGVIVRDTAIATIGGNDAAPLPQPRISVADVAVGEGDRFADVVVSLNAPSASKVTVNYASSDWTANYGDFASFSGTLSFDPGETTQVVRVDLAYWDVESNERDGLERFRFQLSSPTNATLADEGYGWVTIVDNDTAVDTSEIFVRDVIVDEAAGKADFVVTLGRVMGQSAGGTVKVDFSTVDGTAKAGLDYDAAAGTLTFLPGESTKTVSVRLANDTLTEPMEFFDLRLKNAVTGVLADGNARALIGASDGVVANQPTLAAAGAVGTEDEGQLDVMVQLSAPSARTVTATYTTRPGTADSGDYVGINGTLSFAPGETTKVVKVDIAGDARVEGTETLVFALSSPNGALLSANPEVMIVDAKVGDVAVHSLGLGNDVYEVTSAADLFIEVGVIGGTDTIRSYVNGYTLPENVENLVLAHPSVTSGNGNAGDNTFVGTASDNRFDGKAGIDTVVFSGTAAAHDISGSSDNRVVRSAADGTDTLQSIERLRFDDGMLAYDTAPGGQTYLAYAFLNAAFDRAPTRSELSYWTAELGRRSGNSVDLAQEMINHFAPGVVDADLVAYLWFTVVGSPISQENLTAFTGLVRNGTYTQASLVDLAARHELNTVELAQVIGTPMWLDSAYFALPDA